MNSERKFEAILVISTGFLILYYLKELQVFLYISIGVGIVGIFIKPLAVLIAKGWLKLGELLGFAISKVVLCAIFIILIIPISFLYNIFNKDTLKIKRTKLSLWTNRNHNYCSTDLKNSW